MQFLLKCSIPQRKIEEIWEKIDALDQKHKAHMNKTLFCSFPIKNEPNFMFSHTFFF